MVPLFYVKLACGWYESANTDNCDRTNHEHCKSVSSGKALGKLRSSVLFNVAV